jgi:hypothetical protein
MLPIRYPMVFGTWVEASHPLVSFGAAEAADETGPE